jgi:hypothetical protein
LQCLLRTCGELGRAQATGFRMDGRRRAAIHPDTNEPVCRT